MIWLFPNLFLGKILPVHLSPHYAAHCSHLGWPHQREHISCTHRCSQQQDNRRSWVLMCLYIHSCRRYSIVIAENKQFGGFNGFSLVSTSLPRPDDKISLNLSVMWLAVWLCEESISQCSLSGCFIEFTLKCCKKTSLESFHWSCENQFKEHWFCL